MGGWQQCQAQGEGWYSPGIPSPYCTTKLPVGTISFSSLASEPRLRADTSTFDKIVRTAFLKRTITLTSGEKNKQNQTQRKLESNLSVCHNQIGRACVYFTVCGNIRQHTSQKSLLASGQYLIQLEMLQLISREREKPLTTDH